MKEYFLVAKIKSIYNPEGFVSIVSYSDFPDRFFNLKKVFIEVFGEEKEFIVEKVGILKGNFILKFKNFNTDKEVEFLLEKGIYIEKSDLVKLPEDTHFIHDLIGSKVFRNSEFFGYLTEVMSLPANDVFVIKTESGDEILIPAIKEFISSFDLKKKRLDLLPGDEIYYDDKD